MSQVPALPPPPALPPAPAMPAVPPVPKPPGKISKFFSKIASWPKRLLKLSVPAKAAWLSAIALTVVVITAWTVFLVDPDSVPWRHAMTVGRILGVLCLLALIPWVVYRGLKLWLEGDASRFPDIDFAWQAGLTALERNGIDIRSVPIFLVLGSSSQRQEQALFNAAGLSLRVQAVPEGPAPLHWYANPEGIYLCCTESSWTSALAAFEATKSVTEIAFNLPSLESPVAPASLPPPNPGTSVSAPPAPPVAFAPAGGGGDDSIRGTIMLDRYAANIASQGAPPALPAPVYAPPAAPAYSAPAFSPATMQGSTDIKGTMMLHSPLQFPVAGAPLSEGTLMPGQHIQPAPYVPAAPAPPPAAAAPAPVVTSYAAPVRTVGQRLQPVLSPQESAEQLQRLQHVCQLLRRARQPLCAINGILTLLSMQTIQAGPHDVEELQRAVKADLRTAGRMLELRCPVTALVVGLEQEAGFRELVRRVGRDRAAVQRFGQRYDVRSLATSDEMGALCAHVCGAFEDWVYTLFREQDALSRPGNTHLYGLLCKVRLTLKYRLAEILAGGFGYDPSQAKDDSVLFSGCYFAAIGESDDRQAFTKGVFNKLAEEQEEVEWTPRALRHNRRYQRAALLGFALDAALAVALGGMVIYRMFFRA